MKNHTDLLPVRALAAIVAQPARASTEESGLSDPVDRLDGLGRPCGIGCRVCYASGQKTIQRGYLA